MEAATNWLLQTLNDPSQDSLFSVQSRHRARDDDFNLAEVLSFMPEHFHSSLAQRLCAIISPSLAALKDESSESNQRNSPPTQSPVADRLPAIQAASELIWLFVNKRQTVPEGGIFDLICDFHAILLALPDTHLRNQISKTCEWLWSTNDDRRELVVPKTFLFLLLRSFGFEGVALDNSDVKRGSASDVARVYNMRKALDYLELTESDPDAETVRNLLLRCTTSSVYLRSDHGRKFLAYLLTVEDIRDAAFQSLMNQLAVARKTRASDYGAVILYSWKLAKSDWFFNRLMHLAEKAIYSASEPMGTNLRMVLSSFHKSKRDLTVDQLLYRLYGPILYKNLMVANPLVRRNAVTILAESFPIHDPSGMVQEISETIDTQCNKLVELLLDPAAVVRKATIEGTCRVLWILWELVPLVFATKMLDIITTKLAFDSSSSQVRIAVFEGLKRVVNNHLTHQILSIVLPRLGPLIHDNVEKVRLAFLDLLLTLKSKRIRSVRYFDVVSRDDLLTRLPMESPAVAAKIMSLVVSTYFPLERVGKTAEEILASQVRACLSMLRSKPDASGYFYQNLNLYVPLGSLWEFVWRISTIALEAPDEGLDNQLADTRKVRRPKRRMRTKPNDENEPPGNRGESTEVSLDQEQPKSAHNRANLLQIVADVLSSISPSLEKRSNQNLRRYIDDIFGGEGLRPLLIERENSKFARATSWRIASCISSSKMQPIIALWCEQLKTAWDWPRFNEQEVREFEALLSALLLCGFRWKKLSPLCSVVSQWADVAASDQNKARVGPKRSKLTTGTKGQKSSRPTRRTNQAQWTDMRMSSLFALRTLAVVLTKRKDLSEEFRVSLLDSKKQEPSGQDSKSCSIELILCIRKGCLGAVDDFLENYSGDDEEDAGFRLQTLLDALSLLWQLLLTSLSLTPSQKILSSEMREILEWTAGLELITSAARVDGTFARAFAAMSIRFSADAAAIDLLGAEDMPLLVKIASNLTVALDWSEQPETLSTVAQLIRLSFQLKQHHSHLVIDAEREEEYIQPLQEASASLLTTAFEILASCKMKSHSTDVYETTNLARFLGEVLMAFSSGDGEIESISSIGKWLNPSFATTEKAEANALAQLICTMVTDLVVSPAKNTRMDPNNIHSLLVSCMEKSPGESPFYYSRANLALLVVSSISSTFEDSDAVPTDVARQFLAYIEVDINRLCENSGKESEDDGDLRECVSDIRSILQDLQNVCCSQNKSPSTANVDEESTPAS